MEGMETQVQRSFLEGGTDGVGNSLTVREEACQVLRVGVPLEEKGMVDYIKRLESVQQTPGPLLSHAV